MARQPSVSCLIGKTTSTKSSKRTKCSPKHKQSSQKCSDTMAGSRECASEEEPSSHSFVSGSAMCKTLLWTPSMWVGGISRDTTKSCIVSWWKWSLRMCRIIQNQCEKLQPVCCLMKNCLIPSLWSCSRRPTPMIKSQSSRHLTSSISSSGA